MLPTYFEEIGKIPLLSAEEECELSQRIQAGCEKSRNRMIASNLRLVVRIASDFANGDVPMSELISEGNLGLIKAVEKFRPFKGAKFSSYASWWIRQSIQRVIAEHNATIRLTSVARGKLTKLRRAAHSMSEILGRDPTDDELADELGLDASAVQQLKNVGARPASMDAVVSDDGGATLGSLLVDEGAEDPLAALSGKDLRLEIAGLLDTLSARERAVIVHRYGLDGQPAMTLEKIGLELGCTRERTRQLQEQALKRMRRTFSRRQALKFLNVELNPPPSPRSVRTLPARLAA